MPDGSITTASDLIKGLGDLYAGIDLGITLGEVATGDKNIREAYHVVFGITVGAAVASAGASATVALAAGFTAEYAANHVVQWIGALGDLNRDFQSYADEQIEQFIKENSNIKPGTYNNPIELYRGMLGLPENPYNREVGGPHLNHIPIP
ncbi:hypothetical protein [Alterisphingorhabdus coralli]|uniref:Uncharacterized protein n=1 Tax=Alterisphingorhabdus coralli TaxID=3071408 RepID=A0AA97F5B6_9SPHN|nr:hypothetical protein [Parasphingorhabdus sp. SCSIO 66989]WOE74574.1 hypothetical protein RB602_12055 [Parasphingorhabdus sp. SCSIO 66989]